MSEAEKLERILLEHLRGCWRSYNQELFGGAMAPPLLTISDSERRLGAFNGATRELSLGRTLLYGRSFVAVMEVLKHEMAHQFVSEVLRVSDETPHGPTFRAVCQRRGIDASATGVSARRDADDDGMVARVRKLLALAGSDNHHEAEAAMARARRLMLTHNISRQQAQGDGGERFYSVSMGGPQLRMAGWRKLLAGMLTKYFFVEAVIVPSFDVVKARRATEIEIIGTEENVGVATYVHDLLIRSANERWGRYQKTRVEKCRGDKSQFYYGVVTGFSEQLRCERTRGEREGLVWCADPALAAHMGRRFPRLYSGRKVSAKTGSAFREGHEHGRSVTLRRGVTVQQSGTTRLIGGR